MDEADSLCDRVAIMHLGKVVVIGTPAELKASLDGNGSTMDDVFVHYAGGTSEMEGDYGEISQNKTYSTPSWLIRIGHDRPTD